MDQHSANEAMEKFAQSVQRAQDMLAAADEARAQAGFSSVRDHQEFLERQLSVQEIADADDEAAREICRVYEEVAKYEAPINPRGPGAIKRFFQNLI